MWSRVASEIERRGVGFLALAVSEAEAEEDDETFRVGSASAMRIMTDKTNRDIINEVFASFSSKRLVIEEVKKLDEDKAVPYLLSMFGKSLEVK